MKMCIILTLSSIFTDATSIIVQTAVLGPLTQKPAMSVTGDMIQKETAVLRTMQLKYSESICNFKVH